MTDHVEQAVIALPPVLQRRMAHLVLRGWVIGCTMTRFNSASWTARLPAAEAIRHVGTNLDFALKIYSSHTLLTLLDQMCGVVESMELYSLGASGALPDAARNDGADRR